MLPSGIQLLDVRTRNELDGSQAPSRQLHRRRRRPQRHVDLCQRRRRGRGRDRGGYPSRQSGPMRVWRRDLPPQLAVLRPFWLPQRRPLMLRRYLSMLSRFVPVCRCVENRGCL